MIVQIELQPNEVKAIKAYLRMLGEKNTTKDVQRYITNIVLTTLASPQEAVSDYFNNADQYGD